MEKLQPVSYLLGSVSCWVTDWITHPNITGMVAYTAPLNAHLPISSGVLFFFLLGWWADCDFHTMTPLSGSTRRRSMPVRGRLVASQCVPLWVCCSSRGGSNVKIFMGSHGDCPGAIQNPPQKLKLWWFLSKYFFGNEIIGTSWNLYSMTFLFPLHRFCFLVVQAVRFVFQGGIFRFRCVFPRVYLLEKWYQPLQWHYLPERSRDPMPISKKPQGRSPVFEGVKIKLAICAPEMTTLSFSYLPP